MKTQGYARPAVALFSLSLTIFWLLALPEIAVALDEDVKYRQLPSSGQRTYEPDSVNGSGAYLHKYPLSLPPGRSGFSPSLNLTYSNQESQQNSLWGYGWSLDIPHIERVNKIGVNKLYNQGIASTTFSSSISGELLRILSTSTISSFLQESTIVESLIPEPVSFAEIAEIFVSTSTLTVGETILVPTSTQEVVDAGTSTLDQVSNQTSSDVPLVDDLAAQTAQTQPAPLSSIVSDFVALADRYSKPLLLWIKNDSDKELILNEKDIVKPDGSLYPTGTELVGERTSMSKKVFDGLNKDGIPEISEIIYSTPIHYFDSESGKFEDIDTTIKNEWGTYSMKKAPYQASFSSGVINGLININYLNQEFSIDAETQSPEFFHTPSAKGNTVTYSDYFYKGIDLEVTTLSDRILKEIVFRDSAALESFQENEMIDFSFSLSAPSELSLRVEDKELKSGDSISTSQIVEVRSRENVLTTILPPVMRDSAGTLEKGTIPVTITYTLSENTLTLSKHIPTSFFKSAVFPVRADAAFVFGSSLFDTYWMVSSIPIYGVGSWATAHDTYNYVPNYSGATALTAGVGHYYEQDYYGIRRAISVFDTTSLATSTNISVAKIGITLQSKEATDPNSSWFYLAPVTVATSVVPTSIVQADFIKLGTTTMSDVRMVNSSPSQFEFPLNATGIANIKKGSRTLVGWRVGYDLENQSNSGGTNAYNWWLYTSAAADPAVRPYLRISTNPAPNAPTNLLVQNYATTSATTTNPTFSAIFQSSTASDTAGFYQIQITKDPSSWASPYWDSGKLSMSTTSVGQRSPQLPSSALFPVDGTKYYWRIKFWNQDDFESSWSTTGDSFATRFTAEYSAKIDDGSFVRYKLEPEQYWTALDKKGNRYIFGAATTSRIQEDSTTTTAIYRWMVDSITDTNGNSINFSYEVEDGQVYPTSIMYGGVGTGTPVFKVEFLREDRPDIATTSGAGFAVVTKKRIKEILIRTNGQITRRYALGYQPGSNGVRSLLASIQESGWDAQTGTTTLPSTQFEYSRSIDGWVDAGWALPSYYANTWDGGDVGMRMVDANGDSLPDILMGVYGAAKEAWMNSGTNFVNEVNSPFKPPDVFAISGTLNTGYRFGDINGDGISDLLQGLDFYGTYNQATYIGSSTAGWAATSSQYGPLFSTASYGTHDVLLQDINMDGLADIIYLGSGAITYNNGYGWDAGPFLPETRGASQGGHDLGIRLIDINGDQSQDLLISRDFYYNYNYNERRTTYLNTGNGWQGGATSSFPFPFIATQARDNAVRFMDINADGLVDVVYSYLDTNSGGVGSGVYINTGGAWVATSTYTFPTPIGAGSPYCLKADLGVFIADINGDGLEDVVKNNGYDCQLADPLKKTYLRSGMKSDMLTTVKNDKGAKTTIAYTTTANASNGEKLNPTLPINLDVVKSVTSDPGFGGSVSTTTYTYKGGLFYASNISDRKFSGFASSTAVDSHGNKVNTFFYQGNSSDSTNGEYNDHFAKAGMPYRTEVTDSLGNLFSLTIETWARAAYGDGRNFVRLWKTLNQTYDGDASYRSTAREYLHDTATGDLATSTFYGEVSGNPDGTWTDTGSDRMETTYSYAASSTNSTMRLPSREMVKDQSGNTIRDTKWTFDGLSFGSVSKGNLTKEEKLKSGSSYASTTRTYNSYGLVTQSVDPRGGTTTYAYDSLNLYPSTTTNALGHVTVATYDYTSGKVSTTTDPNGRVFVTDFDGLDRPIREKQPDFTTPTTLVLSNEYTYTDTTSTPSSIFKRSYLNAGTSTDTYTYFDGFSRAIQTRKEGETAYVTADTIYNSIGQVGTTSLPYFSSGTAYTSPTTTNYLLTALTYDAAGRAKTLSDVLGTTTNIYSDWATRTIDPLGNTKDTLKDAYGNLVQVGEKIGASIASTTYLWNLNQKLTKITDASSSIRNFTYDNLGRLLVSEDLHASADTTFGTTTRSYDDASNVTSLINPRGQVTSYTYDALNRLKTEDFTGQSGTEISYSYDSCTNGTSRLCRVEVQGSATTTYAYNPIGLTATEARRINNIWATTTYTYLRNGGQDTITYPDNAIATYFYGSEGLLDKVTNKESGANTTTIVNRITYAPTEQIEALDYANGVTSTSTYDKTKKYRLASKLTKNSSTIQNIAYTYDAVGNMTNFSDTASTSASRTVAYTYDSLYRLLSASTTAVAGGTSGYKQSFAYDALGNILSSPYGTYSYAQTGYTNPHAVTQIITNSTSTSGGGGGGSTSTIAVDATSTSISAGWNAGPTTKNWAHTTGGSDRLLVLTANIFQDVANTGAITSATYNGVSLTKATSTNQGTKACEIWYLKNPASGGNTLSVTVTGAHNDLKYSAISLTGVDQTSPLDGFAVTKGSSGDPSVSFTTTSSGEVLVSTLHRHNLTDATTSRTKLYKDLTGLVLGATSYHIATATGAYADTYTGSASANWCMIMAGFKPSVVAGGGTTTSSTTIAMTYDLSGNLLASGSSTYTWNYRDRMTQSGNGIATTTYGYDENNLRTFLTENGITTIYPNKLYNKMGSTGTTTKHVFLPNGQLIATLETGTSTGGGGSTSTIAFNASSTSITTGFGAGPVTKNWTHTTGGSDRLLVLSAAIWQDVAGTGAITSATYNGVALTLATSTRRFGMACETWYLKNPTSGSNTLSVTVTGATDAIKLSGASFTGVDQTTPLERVSGAWGSSGNPAVSLTTTNAGDVIVSTLNRFGTTDASTNKTAIFKDNAVSTLGASSYTLATTATTYTDTYTGSSASDWCMQAAAFKPSTTGGGGGSGSTTLRFVTTDHLNGTSLVTDSAGNIQETFDALPFGATRLNVKAAGFRGEVRKFATLERDNSGLDYAVNRYYDSNRGQFMSQDPANLDIGLTKFEKKYERTLTQHLLDPQALNSYSYALNNPIIKSDPDGEILPLIAAYAVVEIALSAYDAYTTIQVLGSNANTETKLASGSLFAAGLVGPGGGYGLIDDAAKAIKTKTYQLYKKIHPDGKVYRGRTSGTDTPDKNVEKRDRSHHKNSEGYGEAELTHSTSNYDAIRGVEQKQIEADRTRGVSGNAINGVSPSNPKADQYSKAAETEFKK